VGERVHVGEAESVGGVGVALGERRDARGAAVKEGVGVAEGEEPALGVGERDAPGGQRYWRTTAFALSAMYSVGRVLRVLSDTCRGELSLARERAGPFTSPAPKAPAPASVAESPVTVETLRIMLLPVSPTYKRSLDENSTEEGEEKAVALATPSPHPAKPEPLSVRTLPEKPSTTRMR